MSFFFDRTVSVTRPTATLPTTGMARETYASVASGVPASIQMKTPRPTGLPTDDSPRMAWQIYLDSSWVGTVRQNDVLTDDLGRKFRVEGAYPTPLGWCLYALDQTTGGTAS